MNQIPTYLTVEEVAAKVQLRPETIRHAITAGELEALRFGSRYRIAPKDVEAWLDDHRVTGARALQPVSSRRDSRAQTYALRSVAS